MKHHHRIVVASLSHRCRPSHAHPPSFVKCPMHLTREGGGSALHLWSAVAVVIVLASSHSRIPWRIDIGGCHIDIGRCRIDIGRCRNVIATDINATATNINATATDINTTAYRYQCDSDQSSHISRLTPHPHRSITHATHHCHLTHPCHADSSFLLRRLLISPAPAPPSSCAGFSCSLSHFSFLLRRLLNFLVTLLIPPAPASHFPHFTHFMLPAYMLARISRISCLPALWKCVADSLSC